MTSFSSRMSHGRWQDRMAWLPPFGQGNGLDAPSWAPLADIAPELVEGLLAAFRHAGVRLRGRGRVAAAAGDRPRSRARCRPSCVGGSAVVRDRRGRAAQRASQGHRGA